MRWVLLVVLVLVMLAAWRLATRSWLALEVAQAQPQQGGLRVDVPTAEAFEARHLPQAIKIALAELTVRLPDLVADKSRAILLHCRSGAPSAQAEQQPRALDDTNAFNGSYAVAERLVPGLPAGANHLG